MDDEEISPRLEEYSLRYSSNLSRKCKSIVHRYNNKKEDGFGTHRTDATDKSTHRQNLNNLFNILDDQKEEANEPTKFNKIPNNQMRNYMIFMYAVKMMLGLVLRIGYKVTSAIREYLSRVFHVSWYKIQRIYSHGHRSDQTPFEILGVLLLLPLFALIVLVLAVNAIVHGIIEWFLKPMSTKLYWILSEDAF